MTGATFGTAHWLTTAEAAAHTKRPTLAAFRIWARRRGLVSVGRRWDRRDIDAALTPTPIRYRAQQSLVTQQVNPLSNGQR